MGEPNGTVVSKQGLKLLSRLVPHLSGFFISDNYPLPSTLTGQTIARRHQARLSGRSVSWEIHKLDKVKSSPILLLRNVLLIGY